VLVNPMVQAPAVELIEGGQALLDAGVATIDGIGSDIKKEGPVEAAYPGTPLAAGLSLFEAVADIGAHLGDIHCPVLLFSSREDHVVDPVNGDVLETAVRGPVERIVLEDSYHVATLDNDAPRIEARAVEFALAVLGGPGGAAA